MTGLLEAGLTDPNVLAAAIFVATLVLAGFALAIAFPDTEDRQLRRRVQRLTHPREAPVDPEQALEARVASLRRDDGGQRFADLNRAIRRLLPNSTLLRLRLERAGWSISIVDYLLIGLALGLVAGALCLFLWGAPPLLAALVAVAAGIGVPHLALGRAIGRRLRRFTLHLPDAIELIVRGIKSGLPVSEAINAIGQEMEDPIGTEFRNVSDQMRIGVDLDEALWNVARRLDVQEFKFFVISLSIQKETGGNLAEVLENLAGLIRRREQVRLKIKAMSSEARASAMIIGCLPFVMTGLLYVINPDYIMKLFTDPRGWLLTGIGLTMMATGIGVMARMIRFEI